MSPRAVRAFGPGRVNVVGEHTDYNGGRCLPFALHLGVTVTARALPEREVRAHAEDLGQTDAFSLDAPEPAGGWRAYVRGTVAELQSAGWRLTGSELRISGGVPRGAGLSSSAALEAALALALLALAGHDDVDRRRLVPLCSRVENEWVGARTGQLDQSASLLCRPGHALLLDFADGLNAVDVALPQSAWSFAVADSGQPHSHAADAGYNARRAECARACELLSVPLLSEAPRERLEVLPPALRRRAQHVVDENARVDAAVEALRAGDWPGLAVLLDGSHASLRDLFECSTPAVETTVARMKQAGARGARMIGGGFGGHVLALFDLQTPPPPGAVVVAPGAGAVVEPL